jgi:hypothetical protein
MRTRLAPIVRPAIDERATACSMQSEPELVRESALRTSDRAKRFLERDARKRAELAWIDMVVCRQPLFESLGLMLESYAPQKMKRLLELGGRGRAQPARIGYGSQSRKRSVQKDAGTDRAGSRERRDRDDPSALDVQGSRMAPAVLHDEVAEEPGGRLVRHRDDGETSDERGVLRRAPDRFVEDGLDLERSRDGSIIERDGGEPATLARLLPDQAREFA